MAESDSEPPQNGNKEIKEKASRSSNELQEVPQPREFSDWKPDRKFHLAIVSICAGTFMTGIAATSFVVVIPVSTLIVLDIEMGHLSNTVPGHRI